MPSASRPPRPRLAGLLVAQFFGAFNDNAWKLIVAFLALRSLAADREGAALEAAAQSATTLAFVVFTLPLLVFSLPAGLIADRLSKRSVIVAMKVLEVALMTLGTVGLVLWPEGTVVPLVVLGLLGVQSAFFSPAKYGILPEVVPHAHLSRANGSLELWTMLAIIGGSASAGQLTELAGDRTWLPGVVLAGFSVIGLLASRRVPPVPPARAEGNLSGTVGPAWSAIRSDRWLWLTVVGLTFFWSITSLLGQEFLIHARLALRLDEAATGHLLAFFGLGVAGGALAAARLSSGKVESGLIPLGALVHAAFTLALGLFAPGHFGTACLVTLIGLGSGLIVVPLHAVLQWLAPADRRGAVIALSNVFVFGGILAGTLGAGALSKLGLSAREIIVGAGVATVLGTAWAIHLLPSAFLRLLLFLATHTVYRLDVVGRRNVPEEGGALLLPNHVSFIDGLLIMASIDRPVRFVVEESYAKHPLLRPFMKSLDVIPISSTGGPRAILRALRDAGRYLDEGHLTCIFAEGEVTRTGALLPFRRGFERIVRGRTVPIVPVYLDRVWGSIFSRFRQRFVTKLPERLPYPVTVAYGDPLPPDAPLAEVRRAVIELGQRAWTERRGDRTPLQRSFLRLARRRPFGLAFGDATRPRLGRLASAAGAIALARALRERWNGQSNVGVLLPATVAAALTNVAAALAGRTSVNLNFTAGRASMTSAAKQAGLRTVVTSRAFVEKAQLELPDSVEPIWLEDVAGGIGSGARALALLLAAGAPARLVERACGSRDAGAAGEHAERSMDEVVTIIFSSGSTGEPKGVLLSHQNIHSDLDGVAQVFGVECGDRVLGILPLFHSFGYLLLWFATIHDLGVIFHPNPLDAAAVGDIVERRRVTCLIATPTFLQLYARRCTPGQLGSVCMVIAGAEKLPERLAMAFQDKFGIRPVEGYGTTECSPVVAMSSPDYRGPGFYQHGARRGSVGRPLPGVAVRIVDPESFEPLPSDEAGMILVKGDNVMGGYLGRPELTAEVLRDGWYVTGDIGRLDEEGFLWITDRLSRFSKIGGEMVPHGRVEEALHEAAGSSEQVFAVTAVPDERKGERLAVLHLVDEATLPEIVERLAAAGLPNLFVPKLDSFVKVETLPLLGSGKLDLKEMRRIAIEALG